MSKNVKKSIACLLMLVIGCALFSGCKRKDDVAEIVDLLSEVKKSVSSPFAIYDACATLKAIDSDSRCLDDVAKILDIEDTSEKIPGFLEDYEILVWVFEADFDDVTLELTAKITPQNVDGFDEYYEAFELCFYVYSGDIIKLHTVNFCDRPIYTSSVENYRIHDKDIAQHFEALSRIVIFKVKSCEYVLKRPEVELARKIQEKGDYCKFLLKECLVDVDLLRNESYNFSIESTDFGSITLEFSSSRYISALQFGSNDDAKYELRRSWTTHSSNFRGISESLLMFPYHQPVKDGGVKYDFDAMQNVNLAFRDFGKHLDSVLQAKVDAHKKQIQGKLHSLGVDPSSNAGNEEKEFASLIQTHFSVSSGKVQ